ncbi:hypothetical protein BH11ARM1_BH11ARM1_02050 [soil metagenome]
MRGPIEFIDTALIRSNEISTDQKGKVQVSEIYKYISTLNGLGCAIQDAGFSSESRILAKECQADLLSSLLNICCGYKRQAYIALRCALEDAVFFLYFMDHPHEFELWKAHAFQPKVKESISKLRLYNSTLSVAPLNFWLDSLTTQYESLCSSVHPTMGYINSDLGQPIQVQVDTSGEVVQWAESARIIARSFIALLYARFYLTAFEGGKHLPLKQQISSCLTFPEVTRLGNSGFVL